ncbi:unannotated protein [freshwater metagenome]|uniref:Unannotated protein n=1 Tax=freshwater metagenome TaxID=449393 RepID=A0A6J6XA15_9ZZZZ
MRVIDNACFAWSLAEYTECVELEEYPDYAGEGPVCAALSAGEYYTLGVSKVSGTHHQREHRDRVDSVLT